MRNKFQDTCFVCGDTVKPGEGFFQSIGGFNKKTRAKFNKLYPTKSWLVRCAFCVGKGNPTTINN